MGKSRRRNTAKTGDRALYGSRGAGGGDAAGGRPGDGGDDDEDAVYDEVDRYHNRKDEEDFLALGDGEDDEDDEDEYDKQEAVMDLGAGGDSSSSDEGDDDDEDEGFNRKARQQRQKKNRAADDASSSSSDDDDDDDAMMDNMEPEDVRDWGRKKSMYYHGDTADLEIGQEKDDAYLEEEAARELQSSRYADMSEDDFALDDVEGGEKSSGSVGEKKDRRKQPPATADVQRQQEHLSKKKLSTKEKRKYLDRQHPELLPLLSYFSDVVGDLSCRTSVATDALFFGSGNDDDDDSEGEDGGGGSGGGGADSSNAAEQVGATFSGQRYLLTKELLQCTTALNLAAYLLLKSDQAAQKDVDPTLIQSHPVIAFLQKVNDLSQRLENDVEKKVDGLESQLENLAKAAALMKSGEMESDEEEEGDGENDSESSDDEDTRGKDEEENEVEGDEVQKTREADIAAAERVDAAETKRQELLNRNKVLNEARFGLRQSEVVSGGKKKRQQRRRREGTGLLLDTGDGGEDEADAPDATTMKSKALASTLNSIEQRLALRQQRKKAPLPDNIDDVEDDEDNGYRGEDIDMVMNEEDAAELAVRKKRKISSDRDDEDEDEDAVDPFYAAVSEKSRARKDAKKSMYEVAPKFPRIAYEVEGERAVSKAILKNRGLVAHKSKLNRNPRVKKREQYRKALIRRKGAVRDIRAPDEGYKYGGESTGVKTNLSKSRKL